MSLPARHRHGFSLIELLIALAVGAGLLSATWSWAWAAAGAGRTATQQADALSSLAMARRLIVHDVRASQGLASGGVGGEGCGASSLTLLASEGVAGAVCYSWNAVRGVLWRSASSAYVAERAQRFSVRYFDAAGSELVPPSGGYLDAGAAARVKLLIFRLSVSAGPRVETCVWAVGLR